MKAKKVKTSKILKIGKKIKNLERNIENRKGQKMSKSKIRQKPNNVEESRKTLIELQKLERDKKCRILYKRNRKSYNPKNINNYQYIITK